MSQTCISAIILNGFPIFKNSVINKKLLILIVCRPFSYASFSITGKWKKGNVNLSSSMPKMSPTIIVHISREIQGGIKTNL